jgi:hypothetical protein
MIKSVVLDSLKDFKNSRVMMVAIMLCWVLAGCGLQQDSSPSTVNDRSYGFKSRFFHTRMDIKKIAFLGIGAGSTRELGAKITKNDETAGNKKSIER